MLIDALAEKLSTSRAVGTALARLECGESPSVAAPPSVRSLLLAAAFARSPRPTLIVISGEEAARKLALGLSLYLGRDAVMHLPAADYMPWDDKDDDPADIGRRIRALTALHNGERVVVVSSTRALMKRYPPAGRMDFRPLVLEEGAAPEGLEYEQLPAELERLGFHREDAATERGTFSVRGDILDVFSPDGPCPVRVEFFGDEVERIRRIVPSTGQTISDLESTTVYPAREVEVSEKDVASARERLRRAGLLTYEIEADLEAIALAGLRGRLAQYLPFFFSETALPASFLHPEALVVLIEPRSLFDDASRYHDELKARAKAAKASLEGLFASPGDLRFNEVQTLTLLSLIRAGGRVDEELAVKRAESAGNAERFMAQIRGLLADRFAVVLGIGDRRLREEMKLELTDLHIPIAEARDEDPALSTTAVNITGTPIPTPVIVPSAKLAVLSAYDSVSDSPENPAGGRSAARAVRFPYKPGDYVVHAKHGVARFAGMEKQEIDGIWRDYLLLEYAAGDKLYIPVEQIGKITKYVGAKGVEPKLTRLTSGEWGKATKRAAKAAKKLAFDLVDLYVRRSSVKGHAYSPDNDLQREMEALFPYEETSDQAQAIADVKADMESPLPMDRLICGDVGYGKTEVAIRAAFKAIQDGFQVMVLCPTTILAQQHYTTFFERFDPFAVRVEILSRFRTPAQQKSALEGFSDGTVDVLIGTHRLLSHDVAPKNLGLVIIDEEQRFGVGHKEQMKNLREHIDVLTLTATPIPRTLQMSLGGVRDMSLIDTPPSFRIPVEVYVGEWDEDVVGGAIRREIQRGGQVYYVATKIADIDSAIAKVVEAVPEARVEYAHGRMGESKLEDVMERFSAGEVDILVSTTIIESGLDNPHTNTLIIEDSQMLGLSQLYQLKGRVGRSRTQAYAYFLFPSSASLTEDAVERLMAIKENQDFGSGIKIAMRDLEIRGAGSLLGAEQSGNISAIGFEAFTAMLSDYVDEARGGARPTLSEDVVIDLPAGVYLPDDYIESTETRVQVYRDLALARSEDDVHAVFEAISREYGELPEPALNLVSRAYLQLDCRSLGISTVSHVGGKVLIEPVTLNPAQRSFAKEKGGLYFPKTNKLHFRPRGEDGIFEQMVAFLDGLVALEHESEA